MSTARKNKVLFDELEAWIRRKNSFSINEFLKEKELSLDEFEQIANGSKKFMKIWGKAESRAWENVLDALFTKSLPRSRIAEYIKESDTFEGEDPEDVMRSLEKTQLKLELHLTALGDTKSLKKYGRIGIGKMNDFDAIMLCSLQRGIITEEQYREFVAIKEEYPDEDDFEDYE